MSLRSLAGTAAALALLAGCASHTTPAAAPASPPATQPSVQPSTGVTATAASAPAAAQPAGPLTFEQACAPAELLAFVRTQADKPPTGFKEVKVYNCVKNYARLYAAPNPDAQHPVDGDQFFLKFNAGQWQVLARGLSIDCGDNKPQLVDACAAFE